MAAYPGCTHPKAVQICQEQAPKGTRFVLQTPKSEEQYARRQAEIACPGGKFRIESGHYEWTANGVVKFRNGWRVYEVLKTGNGKSLDELVPVFKPPEDAPAGVPASQDSSVPRPPRLPLPDPVEAPKRTMKNRVTIANMIKLGDWLRNHYEEISKAQLFIEEVAKLATEQLGFPVAETTVTKALRACSLARWKLRRSPEAAARAAATKRANCRPEEVNVLADAVRTLYAKLGEPLSEKFVEVFGSAFQKEEESCG